MRAMSKNSAMSYRDLSFSPRTKYHSTEMVRENINLPRELLIETQYLGWLRFRMSKLVTSLNDSQSAIGSASRVMWHKSP